MANQPISSIPSRIKTPRRKVEGVRERFYREVVLTYDGNDCLIWPFPRTKNGYAVMGGKRQAYVHRMACEATHGLAPSPKHHAAHSCGKGSQGCVARRHLSWKTAKENAADKIVHGTVHFAKLTENDVLSIRALRGKRTQTSLAHEFGISQALVSNIQLGRGWDWVK